MRHAPACLLTLALLLLASVATAQRYEWRDVIQEVTIQPDGAVEVRDTRTLWTDGDFGEAFICLDLEPHQRLTLLPNSAALSEGPPAVVFSQPCLEGDGTEVVLRNETRVSERRMRFSYRLEGTVEAYADVTQWYWNLIQQDHPPIIGYDLTVTAPGPMARPYDAYVHRYANPEEPTVSMTPDRSSLSVSFKHIPPDSGVEIRYLMDPNLFTITGQQDMLQALLEDERQLYARHSRGPAYPWNREVVLPVGTTPVLQDGCAEMATALFARGPADCYRHDDTDPAAVAVAVEEAFAAAGYTVMSRGEINPDIAYTELEHPRWTHTILLVFVQTERTGTIIIFDPQF